MRTFLCLDDGEQVRIGSDNNIKGSDQDYGRLSHRSVATITGRSESECCLRLEFDDGTRMKLGLWWLDVAERGSVPRLPVLNLRPERCQPAAAEFEEDVENEDGENEDDATEDMLHAEAAAAVAALCSPGLVEEKASDLPAAMLFMDETYAKIIALEEEINSLSGSANKKERNVKSKELSALKQLPQYIDACKVVKGLQPPHGFFSIRQ